MSDYLDANNEELLKDDIHTFIEAEGLYIDDLSDDTYFSINRFLNHVDEYYSLKKKR